MIKLVDIDFLKPVEYNPREVDEKRLQLIRNSLRTLGFVFPLYILSDGSILSGHQRTLVAREMGYKKVPVVIVDVVQKKVKGINIIFNRATNDMYMDKSTNYLTRKLEEETEYLLKEYSKAPDKFPCMNMVKRNVRDLAVKNIDRFESRLKNYAKSLYANTKIIMPVLITHDDIVVNGLGRIEMMAEKGIKECDCVVLSDSQAEYAMKAVNLISMNFNFDSYKDILRQNAFRRSTGLRSSIGNAYTIGLGKRASKTDIDMSINDWKNTYGTSILDFGAGHATDVEYLKKHGIKCLTFEPYVLPCGKGDPDITLSRQSAIQFLEGIKTQHFDSIILQSVLNSVPFIEDRRHVLSIIASLCDEGTTVHLWMVSHVAYKVKHNTKSFGITATGTGVFNLDYEDRITIGEVVNRPKVQKFHTPKEIYTLCKEFFSVVNVKNCGQELYVRCKGPKEITDQQLNKALEFEFDLPYANGERMNMVVKAKESFYHRLNRQQ